MATATHTVNIFLDGHYRTVTADVRAVQISYGRLRVTDSFRAGSCRISLNNQDNTYGPLAGGTYGDSQWLNAEVRVMTSINAPGVATTLFRGRIEDVDTLYPNSRDSTVIVKCLDGMSLLARTELTDVSFSQEVGSVRFSAVLDDSQVAYPAQPGSPTTADPTTRDIDASSVTMQAADVAEINTTTYTERLSQSEDGAIFVRHGSAAGAAVTAGDRGDILTYKKRYADSGVTGLTFGAGDGTAAAEPAFTNITTMFGTELLYTRGVYQRAGGDDQIFDENVFGQPAYGIRTLVRRNLLNDSDDDVLTACKNFIALHSTPALRVSSLECKPLALTDAQAEKVAKLTIFDGIRAQFQPIGAGAAMNQVLRVESVTHEITPKDWTMRLGTSGSGDTVFLILDSADFGILNTNKLAP